MIEAKEVAYLEIFVGSEEILGPYGNPSAIANEPAPGPGLAFFIHEDRPGRPGKYLLAAVPGF